MTIQSLNFSFPSLLLEELEVAMPQDLLPSWFLWTYITIIEVGGVFANGVLAGHLFRKRAFPAVLHLCIADVASLLFIAPYEVFVLADSSGAWFFPPECCQIFLGLEVLLGTSTIYIIIVMNFIAVFESQNTSLSIGLPLFMVWTLAFVLSIPNFIFGEVITPRTEYNVCNLPRKVALLVGSFRLTFPVFLLGIGTFMVITEIFKMQKNNDSVRLAVVSSVTYIAISVQRSVFGVMYEVRFSLSDQHFGIRTPPLAVVTQHPVSTLFLALIHYALSAVRPIILWSISPNIRSNTPHLPGDSSVMC